MIDDFLIIPSVIAQILYPTAELAVPIATQNAEIETQPLITKKKKKKEKEKCSKQAKALHIFLCF